MTDPCACVCQHRDITLGQVTTHEQTEVPRAGCVMKQVQADAPLQSLRTCLGHGDITTQYAWACQAARCTEMRLFTW